MVYFHVSRFDSFHGSIVIGLMAFSFTFLNLIVFIGSIVIGLIVFSFTFLGFIVFLVVIVLIVFSFIVAGLIDVSRFHIFRSRCNNERVTGESLWDAVWKFFLSCFVALQSL
jgi:hypothetical protein